MWDDFARRLGRQLESHLDGGSDVKESGSPTTRDPGSPTTRDSAIGSPTTRNLATVLPLLVIQQ